MKRSYPIGAHSRCISMVKSPRVVRHLTFCAEHCNVTWSRTSALPYKAKAAIFDCCNLAIASELLLYAYMYIHTHTLWYRVPLWGPSSGVRQLVRQIQVHMIPAVNAGLWTCVHACSDIGYRNNAERNERIFRKKDFRSPLNACLHAWQLLGPHVRLPRLLKFFPHPSGIQLAWLQSCMRVATNLQARLPH